MVITPLNIHELNKIFDHDSIKTLKYYIEMTLMCQPEMLEGQSPLSIQIPKEHIEQWIVQSLEAKSVGSGNYPIDVVINSTIGADVKMISCKIDNNGKLKNSISNESSLLQNFKDTGNQLDYHFKQRDYKTICDGWKEMLYQKLSKAKVEHGLSRFMYIFIMRGHQVFYLSAFEVYIDQLEFVCHGKASETTLQLEHFIDERIGQVSVYKSKKRLELRLFPHFLVNNGYAIPIEIHYSPKYKNIKELIRNGKIKEYQLELFQNIINKIS